MSDPYLILLGTGDAESMRYWNNNALVRTPTENILIDCGFTIKYALSEIDLTLREIDGVFITHIHGDHVHGLERLGFESRYLYQRRPKLYLEPDLYSLLWDQCLAGSMADTSNGPSFLEDFFEIHFIQDHHFTAAGCHFRTFPTLHTLGKPSYGLIINEQLMFTSDTTPLPNLADFFSKGLIIHDVCLQAKNPVHATLQQLLAQYPLALRKRMLLIHYGDTIELYRALIEREFQGVAHQGQIFSLKSNACHI